MSHFAFKTAMPKFMSVQGISLFSYRHCTKIRLLLQFACKDIKKIEKGPEMKIIPDCNEQCSLRHCSCQGYFCVSIAETCYYLSSIQRWEDFSSVVDNLQDVLVKEGQGGKRQEIQEDSAVETIIQNV